MTSRKRLFCRQYCWRSLKTMMQSSARFVVLRRLGSCTRSRPSFSSASAPQLVRISCHCLTQRQPAFAAAAAASASVVLPRRFLATPASSSSSSEQEQQQPQPEPDWVRAAIQKMIEQQQQSANGTSSSPGESAPTSVKDLDKSLQALQVRC